jgi:hypothetical protein
MVHPSDAGADGCACFHPDELFFLLAPQTDRPEKLLRQLAEHFSSSALITIIQVFSDMSTTPETVLAA